MQFSLFRKYSPIFDNILALKKQGRTVIYTTHYMEEAEKLCDRVGIVDHGKLLAMDTVNRLIDAHGGRSVLTVESADGESKWFVAAQGNTIESGVTFGVTPDCAIELRPIVEGDRSS